MNLVLKNSIRCKKCNSILESKSTHDFNWCDCKSIFIDGGFDYCRYGGKGLDYIENLSVIIDEETISEVTMQETDTELFFEFTGKKYSFSKLASGLWKLQKQRYMKLLEKQ